jgi:hypothetical protein
MMKIRSCAKIYRVLIALGVSSANAFDLQPTIDLHGFGTLGASITNANDVTVIDPITKYTFGEVPAIGGVRNKPTFQQNTLGGLRFIAEIGDNTSFTAQFLSLGEDNFQVYTDWLYFDWRINQNWDFKAGRTWLPLHLFSQDVKIGYSYPWARLPIEFYNFLSLSDFNGISIQAAYPIAAGWTGVIKAGFGNLREFAYDDYTAFAFNVDPVFGVFGRNVVTTELILANEWAKLRAAYIASAIDATFDGNVANVQNLVANPCASFNIQLVPQFFELTPTNTPYACIISETPGAPYTVPAQLSIVQADPFIVQYLGSGFGTMLKNMTTQFVSLGYDINWHNLISIAEWKYEHVDDKFFPTSTAWYVLLGYNFNDITVHVTYSTTRTNNDAGRVLRNTVSDTYINPYSLIGPPPPYAAVPETMQTSINTFLEQFNSDQSSIIAGIRYDVIPGVDIKLDYQYVKPRNDTAGLFYTSNGPTAPGKNVSWVTAVIDVAF